MKITNSRECLCDNCKMKIEVGKGIRISRATYIHEECPRKIKIVDVPTLNFEDDDKESVIRDIPETNDNLEDR